ncbi:MAG: replication initiation factor [Methylophilaceae bacterium]|nr:replication initiation factor [Methyloradius sp.]
MTTKKSSSGKTYQSEPQNLTASRYIARTGECQADEDREAVAVPSNTAINNSNNESYDVKVLRFGIDSLYLSYQGELYPEVNEVLKSLKAIAQSEQSSEQSKAQYVIGDHLFEVKDKGSSFFNYIIEDNAFRIQLSRPGKSVPMAYVKLSSEYLTHKTPEDAEKALNAVLSQLGMIDGAASVSRIDMFVDFVSHQDMEAWNRSAWVTHASSVNAYAVDNQFTGWAIGLGGVMAGRLYNKILEIMKSNKGYLIPLWQEAGWQPGEPIWRLEFEFKRQMLTQKGLVKLHEVLANLNGLWSYATTEWLKLTLPNPEDATRSRWPIHPMWAALSSVDWETNGGALQNRFSNERTPEDRISLNRAFSALTTWMAAHGFRDYEDARQPFLKALTHYINNRAMDWDTSFEELINEKVSIKARQFNSLNNIPDNEDNLTDAARAYREASDGE